MLYAGKTLKEVAGYTTWQMVHVIGRERDKSGCLVRKSKNKLPVDVDDDGMVVVKRPVGYGTMYRQVKLRQGMTPKQAGAAWEDFKRANPGLKRWAERGPRLG